MTVAVRARSYGPTAALVAMTAIWGSTFIVVKDAVAKMPPTDFLTWRFGIATLTMLVIRPRSVATLGRDGRRKGLLIGIALGAGYLFQTVGLQHTSAAISGFVTGMFVVFAPLGTWLLLRKPPTSAAWMAVLVAVVGLGFLSLQGFSVSSGILLTLGCAAMFALQIVGLGEWAGSYDTYGLAVLQLLTTTVMAAAVALPGGLDVPPDASVWGAIALTSLAATALAFAVQTWAQARLDPTRAAVVLTMEPVFATLFAIGLAGERLWLRQWFGAALVLAAMLIVEIRPRRDALWRKSTGVEACGFPTVDEISGSAASDRRQPNET